MSTQIQIPPNTQTHSTRCRKKYQRSESKNDAANLSGAEDAFPPTPLNNSKSQANKSNITVHHSKLQLSDKLKKRFKNGRKRSRSFSAGCAILNPKPVLPSKFLLGGNINDPLNLNSLQDEEINRAMNAVTPKSSPIPTPPRRKGQIEVIIPKNLCDPLNLIDCADNAEYELQLTSPLKRPKKKKPKKRRTISGTGDVSDVDLATTSEPKTEAITPETQADSAKIPEVLIKVGEVQETQPKPVTLELSPKKGIKRKNDEHKDSAKKLRYSLDKIVSPVVPQPGSYRGIHVSKMAHEPRVVKIPIGKMPAFKEKDKKFQYGNYNRYYGYRNPHNEMDPRLKVFSHHLELFDNKDVLDIGCNIGHITLTVSRDFGAKSVVGIDIDDKLIGIARKNIKHYVKLPTGSTIKSPSQDESPRKFSPGCTVDPQGAEKGKAKRSEFFPLSMPILYGAIDIPGFRERQGRGFPQNVTFKKCNYILEDDALLALEQPQFDTILCLSITKWIHLNFGDDGLKQAFRRMYAQLRPGGKLVLEPQHWASYKSKKKLTETIFKNYNSIEFFPNNFTEYLLSPVVGFAKSEIIGCPQNSSKGFRRPIQVYTKSTMFPSERVEATPRDITPNNPVYSETIYQSIMRTQKYEPNAHNSEDSMEYLYSGILEDRYNYAEDEVDANNSIENSLKLAHEANMQLEEQKSLDESSEKDSGNNENSSVEHVVAPLHNKTEHSPNKEVGDNT